MGKLYARKKEYVKVVSTFDLTGYMNPQKIIWNDGKISNIEKVTDYRPASTLEPGLAGDVYTVIIKGQPTHLFFEKVDPRFAGRIGRWYVEPMAVIE